MRRWAVLVSVLLIVSSGMSLAWGPLDPTDGKADPDGDKLGNLDEFRAGTNPLNPDTDGGGCWDGWEVLYKLDPNNPADDTFDMDNDGWDNLREYVEGTNPLKANTDDDRYPIDSTDPEPLIPNWEIGKDPGWGEPDKPEVPLPDFDKDGIADMHEPYYGTDPFDPDCDDDLLLDGREVVAGTDPFDPDTDDDGLWDGQEVERHIESLHYTDTSPHNADTDGDGIGDYEDDVDGDGLANGAEWLYGEDRVPVDWTDPRVADTDGDHVLDGLEVEGNPANGWQTSHPLFPDTDFDRLPDDIDPRTWDPDVLPESRIRGSTTHSGPSLPASVSKGTPFNVKGWVEYNTTELTFPGSGDWRPIETPMTVQVWVVQDGEVVPISDPVVTGSDGMFKVSCTIGDDLHAGIAVLMVTASIHATVAYYPSAWDDTRVPHLR